ncbi:MAG: hypothetical protein ACK449_11475 [Planctomycetota bacterium]
MHIDYQREPIATNSNYSMIWFPNRLKRLDCDDDSGYDDKCPVALHIRPSGQESRGFTDIAIPKEFPIAFIEIHQTHV